MHKGYKKYIQNLSGKNMEQKCHYKNLEINEWKILEMKLDKIRLEGVNWIQQAQNMTQQWVITMKITFWLQETWKTYWIHESLIASHEGLCSVQSVGQGIITIFLHAH